MPRVLVTGSAGFIGCQVVQAFADAGWAVRGFDVLPSSADFDAVEANLLDRDALDRALQGIDLVCHQAAKVGLGVELQDLPDYVTNNDLATAQLLAAMDRADVRQLVLASSMVVYGDGAYRCQRHGSVVAAPRDAVDLERGIFDPRCSKCGAVLVPGLVGEHFPLDPRNVYAATKVAQEYLVRAWARERGTSAIALRYHNVYGPGMPRHTPYAGVASLFRAAILRGEAPRVFEDGLQRRDFVHVRDVARANVVAAERNEATGVLVSYNIASGTVRTVGDLAIALTEAHGGPPPVVTGEYRLGDVRHITASADAAHRDLGWRAVVEFADGIAELS